MRQYELMFIVHPDLDENASKEVIERVKSWITDEKARLPKWIYGENASLHTDPQSYRRFLCFNGNQAAASYCVQLERNLRFQEQVIRFQLIAK